MNTHKKYKSKSKREKRKREKIKVKYKGTYQNALANKRIRARP